MLLLVGGLWAMAVSAWAGAAPPDRAALVWGTTWRACTLNIVLLSVPVFAATATLTVPLPVPDPLEPALSHAALLVVLQAQVLPAVTPTATDSPAAGEVLVVGVIV